jgi:hypothetical protein
MPDEDRMVNGRRLSDDMHVRITLLENAVIELESDIREHRMMTGRMCDTLDRIDHQIGAIVSAIAAIQWLKIPK